MNRCAIALCVLVLGACTELGIERIPAFTLRVSCDTGVFDYHHIPGDTLLLGLDNVVLSPHQGSATHKTRWSMGDLVVRNLKAHFAGEPLISPVV